MAFFEKKRHFLRVELLLFFVHRKPALQEIFSGDSLAKVLLIIAVLLVPHWETL